MRCEGYGKGRCWKGDNAVRDRGRTGCWERDGGLNIGNLEGFREQTDGRKRKKREKRGMKTKYRKKREMEEEN